ncbi:DNA polymerase [Hypnocyclicus thermotrophus]|uniref:DNA polymerase n=1 Tax=Hypnocyclicus thermotrophus TaxID=1627895 RepID=A0AA46I4W3_9FUSO|nr:uracil-DNA glycosylase [Hypnocyclicus thermotrophus]TDT67849.1 DNA polymerase [Hypnocyclicus thermotrophus]
MDKNLLWEELAFEISSTKIANLGNRNEKVLLGAGNKQAKVMFIGNDLNLFEDETGNTLPGTSGSFFFQVCDLVDITLDDMYITNIIKCNAKFEELTKQEINFYKDILHMQIAIINPKIIVTLGKTATEVLLEQEVDIRKIHGDVYEWNGGILLIPLFDPSYLLRETDKQMNSPRWLNWQDMKMIKEKMELL